MNGLRTSYAVGPDREVSSVNGSIDLVVECRAALIARGPFETQLECRVVAKVDVAVTVVVTRGWRAVRNRYDNVIDRRFSVG
ncbi:MAG: hypothetical protein R3E58_19840 [Phycisphaerae bacterium]